jgi:protein-L-isoaspartate(D-aspartate) O-methyltransferase
MTFPADSSAYTALRERMVEDQLRGRGIADPRVLEAMRRVPRHEFAPPAYRPQAYADYPLPLAEGQTISQPYIVALMLVEAAITPQDRVLEIGTGSGYATAVLAELAKEVVSIERHASLASSASERLSLLGSRNVRVLHADGSRGFRELAPYDVILVWAAAPELPRQLPEQLAEGGRMVMPVGLADSQQLQFIQKHQGAATIRQGALCLFVPLVAGDVGSR